MRVITGTLRGRRLYTLEGESVRPTEQRIKEAIFSILQFDIPYKRVIDLFSGSGQLGIEALSRGALSCLFVDRSKEASAVIKKNIALCRLEDRARLLNCDAIDYLRRPPRQDELFDIAILVPPYGLGLAEKALSLIDSRIAPGGIVLAEHEGGLMLPESFGGLRLRKRYSYGKRIGLTIYDKLPGEDII